MKWKRWIKKFILFFTIYKTYLPTKEQLKADIESQKAIFEIQQQEKKESNEEWKTNYIMNYYLKLKKVLRWILFSCNFET